MDAGAVPAHRCFVAVGFMAIDGEHLVWVGRGLGTRRRLHQTKPYTAERCAHCGHGCTGLGCSRGFAVYLANPAKWENS